MNTGTNYALFGVLKVVRVSKYHRNAMSIRQHLRLYLAGPSWASNRALSDVRMACDQHLAGRHCLDIIDIERRPQLARLDHIIIVPTLVRWFPGHRIKITGDLSDPERILSSLEQTPDSAECEMHSVLKYLLQGAIKKTAADMGTVQLLQRGADCLRIEAHVGLQRDFVDYFRYLSQEESAAGASVVTRQRVVVEDVMLSPILFGPESLRVVLDAGVRALHCAPLMSRLGDVLGVVTVYYRKPTLPFERDKYLLTESARRIARYLQDLSSVLFRMPLQRVK
jgi:KaiB domain/GAF domain